LLHTPYKYKTCSNIYFNYYHHIKVYFQYIFKLPLSGCVVFNSAVSPAADWLVRVRVNTHSFVLLRWLGKRHDWQICMIVCCFGIPFSVMTVCNICKRWVRLGRLKKKSKNLTSPEVNVMLLQSTLHYQKRQNVWVTKRSVPA